MIKLDLKDASVTLYEEAFDQKICDQWFQRLMKNIAWQQQEIQLFGKWIKEPRLTAWYGDGDSYTYAGKRMEANPWNEDLLQIKDKLVDLLGLSFNGCLLNLYRNGADGMGWHSDDEKELGHMPKIASVSLGATRVFQLRHKKFRELGLKKTSLNLTQGSVLLMQGETQKYWKHCLPKTAKAVEPRINLTFRQLF